MPSFPLGLFLLHRHLPIHMTDSCLRVPSWLTTCPSLCSWLSLLTPPIFCPICSSSFSCSSTPQTFLSASNGNVSGSWKLENLEHSSSFSNQLSNLEWQISPITAVEATEDTVLDFYPVFWFDCRIPHTVCRNLSILKITNQWGSREEIRQTRVQFWLSLVSWLITSQLIILSNRFVFIKM